MDAEKSQGIPGVFPVLPVEKPVDNVDNLWSTNATKGVIFVLM